MINLHYEVEVFMTRDFLCRKCEVYPALAGVDSPGVEGLVVKVVVIRELDLSDTLGPGNGLCAPSHSNLKFLLLPPTSPTSLPRLSCFSDSSASPVFPHMRRTDHLWGCVDSEVDKIRGDLEIISHTAPVL